MRLRWWLTRVVVGTLLLVRVPIAQAQTDRDARGTAFALTVADLNASIAWYRDTLGLKLDNRVTPANDVEIALLSGDAFMVELIRFKASQATRVEDDMTKLAVSKLGVFLSGYQLQFLTKR